MNRLIWQGQINPEGTNMSKHKKLILWGVMALVATGLVAGCSHWHQTPAEHADYITHKISKKLDLNQRQIEKLDELKSEMLTVTSEFKQRHENVHNNFISTFSLPVMDQAGLLTLVQAQTQQINDRAPRVVSAIAGFYDSLTPEQQAELREHLQKKAVHHNKHWH